MMDEGFTPLGSAPFYPRQFQVFTRLFKWQTRVIHTHNPVGVFVGRFATFVGQRIMRRTKNEN